MTGTDAPRRTIVLPDAGALSHVAAHWIAGHVARADGEIFLCLSGGSTPQRLYAHMAEPEFAAAFPWQRTRWFFGDDRFVPESDPRSNAAMARRALFDHVPVPADRVHAIPILADPEASARAYEALLRDLRGADVAAGQPLFDIMLCGLGLDGHTASLFPGKPAEREGGRWVVGVPEAGQEPFVPRVTLTFPALDASRWTAFLVAGPDKRPVLGRIAAGEDLPAARVTAREELVWFLDAAAAAP